MVWRWWGTKGAGKSNASTKLAPLAAFIPPTRPWSGFAQLKKHLARFWNQKNAFVLPVRVLLRVNRVGIAIAQIDLLAFFTRDAGGQGNLRAALLNAVFVGANAAHVRGMRQRAPGILLILFPLFEKVIAAVIADCFDQVPMRSRDLMNLRRIDDKFAAVRKDRLELMLAASGERPVKDAIPHSRAAST
jgi:hypothetical protein